MKQSRSGLGLLGWAALAAGCAESVPPATPLPATVVVVEAAPPEQEASRLTLAGPQVGPDEVADPRDGQVYRTVLIGGQRWFAENARHAIADSWCYGDQGDTCAETGRLYTWNAALHACPPGAHLPSEEEWTVLEKEVGEALAPLMERGATGLGIRMTGQRKPDGEYKDKGAHFFYWTSTEYSEDRARIRWNLTDDRLQIATDGKDAGYSVRCLEDR